MTNTPDQVSRIRACDAVLASAAAIMQNDLGASLEMIIDRLMTFALVQAATVGGKEATADMLRLTADNVEGGLLDDLPQAQRAVH